MFVDTSRIKDLEQLKAWSEDYKYTPARRKLFFRTIQKIKGQLHDTKLSAMRERLIKATQANDPVEMWKLTNVIKDYAKEERVGQRYE